MCVRKDIGRCLKCEFLSQAANAAKASHTSFCFIAAGFTEL
jgi:hypothetical protein